MSDNPFVRYRELLDSHRRALAGGLSDAWFIDTVARLDDAIAEVDGHGFFITPFAAQPALAASVGLDAELWVKNETDNVSGSHKSRHLFGLALHAAVDAALAPNGPREELAIASCGNAALAAAVVARATNRPLRVFIPPWAEAGIVERLAALEANTEVCPRREGEVGDPCFLRYREAVTAGAEPFTCQGTESPRTFDGGRTIGWEMAEHLANVGSGHIDRVFVQVGGGALASACFAGITEGVERGWLDKLPILHAVQTEGAWPLVRAWDRLGGDLSGSDDSAPITNVSRAARAQGANDRPWTDAMDRARSEPDRYMWPWEEEPYSLANGILDDVTYDWAPVTEAMLRSGGWPVVTPEDQVVDALSYGREAVPSVSATGTSGFAGLLTLLDIAPEMLNNERLVVLFTGAER